MAEVTSLSAELLQIYNSAISPLPFFAQKFIGFFLIVFLVVAYSIFIWQLHIFIAHKNILKLNLKRYRKSNHPYSAKISATIFYFLEYILILPLMVFIWFFLFTIFLIVLTEEVPTGSIVLISATIVAVIRIISYYRNDLAKELAKLLPLTLLAIAITTPSFFKVTRVIEQLSQIPAFFNEILSYLIFIIILEIILRVFELFFELIGITEEDED